MTAWNKGLTKDNDPRVAAYGKKSGETRRGKEPWNKGLRGLKNPKNSERLREYFANPANRARIGGENGSNWKGDAVGYGALHVRLSKHKTGTCVACGAFDRRTEMALIHGRATHRDKNGNQTYSVNLCDYRELCLSCHHRYDKGPRT